MVVVGTEVEGTNKCENPGDRKEQATQELLGGIEGDPRKSVIRIICRRIIESSCPRVGLCISKQLVCHHVYDLECC